MREIILKKRYPHSREEDITDAFMRGYEKGKADRQQGEWIDANALAHKVAINGDADFINKVTKLMIDAPSIDIVRCRECKYFIDNLTEDDTDEAYDSCRWDWSRKIPTADDFCSYGERRE